MTSDRYELILDRSLHAIRDKQSGQIVVRQDNERIYYDTIYGMWELLRGSMWRSDHEGVMREVRFPPIPLEQVLEQVLD